MNVEHINEFLQKNKQSTEKDSKVNKSPEIVKKMSINI